MTLPNSLHHMLLKCHLTWPYNLTGIAAYINSTKTKDSTVKPAYNGFETDRIFSVAGRFRLIQASLIL
jgi:hypothetical protein